MALSDALGFSFQLSAGAAIVQDANGRYPWVQMGPNGQAYPAVTSDYAAVTNVGTDVVSPTTIAATSNTAAACNYRQPLVRGSDGSIYVLVIAAAGPTIYKYSPTGALIGSVNLTAGGYGGSQHLFFLSNGNICAVYNTTSTAFSFAIVAPTLSIVKASTAIDAAVATGSQNGAPVDAIPLSGGGFAVCYRYNTTATQQRMAIYDNTGSVVFAAASILALAATTGTTSNRIVQLSNGNIAVAVYSTVAGSAGLYIGVVSATGASVVAFAAQVVSTTSTAIAPEISAFGGYFAVALADITNFRVWVFSNAGAQQGGTFVASTIVGGNLYVKLLNDGTQFWVFWDDSNATGSKKLSSVSTAGVVSTMLTGAAGSYNVPIDAYYENGFIVCSFGLTTYASGRGLFVMSTVTSLGNPATLQTNTTGNGTGTNIAAASPSIVSGGGDFVCVTFNDTGSNNAGMLLAVTKYVNSAIMGVAQSAAAVGAMVSVSPKGPANASGAYGTSTLLGTSPKIFDHTTGTNIYGNKGVMLTNGGILKGM